MVSPHTIGRILLFVILTCSFVPTDSKSITGNSPKKPTVASPFTSMGKPIDISTLILAESAERTRAIRRLKPSLRREEARKLLAAQYDETEATINFAKELLQRNDYAALAFSCFLHYIETGSLTTPCLSIYDGGPNGSIDLDQFDFNLMNESLANYGLTCDGLRVDVKKRALAGIFRMKEVKDYTLKLKFADDGDGEREETTEVED